MQTEFKQKRPRRVTAHWRRREALRSLERTCSSPSVSIASLGTALRCRVPTAGEGQPSTPPGAEVLTHPYEWSSGRLGRPGPERLEVPALNVTRFWRTQTPACLSSRIASRDCDQRLRLRMADYRTTGNRNPRAGHEAGLALNGRTK